MWKIFPLNLGIYEVDKSAKLFRKGQGEKVNSSFLAYYLTDGTRKLLVDTGPSDLKLHPYVNAKISEENKINNALNKIGIQCKEIEIVFLTHLHWDHIGGIHYFTEAEFIVSKKELFYAINPLPILFKAYESPQLGIIPSYLKVLSRVKAIDFKEEEIIPGITILPTPGHSVGSISLIVETKNGPYIISGDAVYHYDNLKGDPQNGFKYYPSGTFTNLDDMWESLALIDKRAQFKIDHVLPGHDPAVLNNKCYPI